MLDPEHLQKMVDDAGNAVALDRLISGLPPSETVPSACPQTNELTNITLDYAQTLEQRPSMQFDKAAGQEFKPEQAPAPAAPEPESPAS